MLAAVKCRGNIFTVNIATVGCTGQRFQAKRHDAFGQATAAVDHRDVVFLDQPTKVANPLRVGAKSARSGDSPFPLG